MAEPRDNAGVIAPPPLIALATIVLGLALDYVLPAYVLRAVLPLSARIGLAAVLLAAGGSLGVPALFAFRAAGTHVEPWKPASAVVTRGIYRYLRNPMYVALALGVAGVAVALTSDWTLVLMVPAALVMHYGVVRREERYLIAKFGEPYRRYLASVPRYGWPG